MNVTCMNAFTVFFIQAFTSPFVRLFLQCFVSLGAVVSVHDDKEKAQHIEDGR